MAIIAHAPLVLKDVILSIGTDDYRYAVDQVSFTPSASTITWTGLGLNTYTDISTATWALTLNYVQDWDTTNSLSRRLFEDEGETVAMTFKPRSGSGPSFTANVIVTPGAIGGSVNAVASTSVTLPCTGKPTLVPAV